MKRMPAACRFLFPLLLAFILPPRTSPAPYRYLPVNSIVDRLRHLHATYPSLTTLYAVQDLPSALSLGTATSSACTSACPGCCKVWVLELGSPASSSSSSSAPSAFLSGSLHGNEAIGPTAVVELATAMLENYGKPGHRGLTRLMDTTTLVVMPLANPAGYARDARTENGLDPNRDFAFDQDPGRCMQTIAARSINEVWRRHVFSLAVTFHGGDNLIAYAWGDTTHCPGGKGSRDMMHCDNGGFFAPDDAALAALTTRTARLADAGPFAPDGPYDVGPLSGVIYAVGGGMEDWAYGGSWHDAAVVCRPTANGGYAEAKTRYNNGTLRAVNLLVETADQKRPPEKTLGDTSAVLDAVLSIVEREEEGEEEEDEEEEQVTDHIHDASDPSHVPPVRARAADACRTCKAGGPDDGGMSLVSFGDFDACTSFCSRGGFCGTSRAYALRGTDCRFMPYLHRATATATATAPPDLDVAMARAMRYSGDGDGHVPRNMRLALAALDALVPRIDLVGAQLESVSVLPSSTDNGNGAAVQDSGDAHTRRDAREEHEPWAWTRGAGLEAAAVPPLEVTFVPPTSVLRPSRPKLFELLLRVRLMWRAIGVVTVDEADVECEMKSCRSATACSCGPAAAPAQSHGQDHGRPSDWGNNILSSKAVLRLRVALPPDGEDNAIVSADALVSVAARVDSDWLHGAQQSDWQQQQKNHEFEPARPEAHWVRLRTDPQWFAHSEEAEARATAAAVGGSTESQLRTIQGQSHWRSPPLSIPCRVRIVDDAVGDRTNASEGQQDKKSGSSSSSTNGGETDTPTASMLRGKKKESNYGSAGNGDDGATTRKRRIDETSDPDPDPAPLRHAVADVVGISGKSDQRRRVTMILLVATTLPVAFLCALGLLGERVKQFVHDVCCRRSAAVEAKKN